METKLIFESDEIGASAEIIAATLARERFVIVENVLNPIDYMAIHKQLTSRIAARCCPVDCIESAGVFTMDNRLFTAPNGLVAQGQTKRLAETFVGCVDPTLDHDEWILASDGPRIINTDSPFFLNRRCRASPMAQLHSFAAEYILSTGGVIFSYVPSMTSDDFFSGTNKRKALCKIMGPAKRDDDDEEDDDGGNMYVVNGKNLKKLTEGKMPLKVVHLAANSMVFYDRNSPKQFALKPETSLAKHALILRGTGKNDIGSALFDCLSSVAMTLPVAYFPVRSLTDSLLSRRVANFYLNKLDTWKMYMKPKVRGNGDISSLLVKSDHFSPAAKALHVSPYIDILVRGDLDLSSIVYCRSASPRECCDSLYERYLVHLGRSKTKTKISTVLCKLVQAMLLSEEKQSKQQLYEMFQDMQASVHEKYMFSCNYVDVLNAYTNTGCYDSISHNASAIIGKLFNHSIEKSEALSSDDDEEVIHLTEKSVFSKRQTTLCQGDDDDSVSKVNDIESIPSVSMNKRGVNFISSILSANQMYF